mgnify:CR=1 FL=1
MFAGKKLKFYDVFEGEKSKKFGRVCKGKNINFKACLKGKKCKFKDVFAGEKRKF